MATNTRRTTLSTEEKDPVQQVSGLQPAGGSMTAQQYASAMGATDSPAGSTIGQTLAMGNGGPGAGQSPSNKSFTYDLNGDALYQQYRDRYLQNAKRSMQDTMGQAASLTGGYGSTYGQAVGQQAYDETMRGLTDMIPQLEQNAYGKWKDQQALTQQQYSNLSSAIMNTGYVPSDDELEAAGMSKEQAEALRQAWIARNPGAAYMAGALSAENYFKLTGQAAPGTAGGGGGGGGSRKSGNAFEEAQEGLAEAIRSGGTREEINNLIWLNEGLTPEQKRELIASNTAPLGQTRAWN